MVTSSAGISAALPVGAGPDSLAHQRRAVAARVAQINGSGFLGADRQLSWSVDPRTRQMVIRVVDSQTSEVLRQFPSEQLLNMAAQMAAQETAQPLSVQGLPTYA